MTMEDGKTYYNIRPIVIITIGFLLGIISAYCFLIQKVVLALIILSVSIALLFAWFCISRFKNKGKGIVALISIVFVVFGFLYSFARSLTNDSVPLNSEVEFVGTVVEMNSESVNGNEYEYELVVIGISRFGRTIINLVLF